MRAHSGDTGIRGAVAQAPCDTPLEWATVAFHDAPGGSALQRSTTDTPARQYTILGCEPVLTLEADTDAAAGICSRS